MSGAEIIRALAAYVQRLERERDDAQCAAARLARENGEQCDRIAELETELEEARAKWRAA